MLLVNETNFEDLIIKNGQNSLGCLLFIERLNNTVGYIPKQFVVVGGAQGSYKSTYAINIAYNNAIESGWNSCIFELEMTEQAILTRLLVRHSHHPKFQRFLNPDIDITVAKCEKNDLSEDARSFLFDTVAKDLKKNPNYGRISIVALNDFYSSGNDVIKLISIVDNKLSQEGRNNNLHLLIIDYIQVLARDTCRYSNASDQYKMVGDLARYLKELSLLYGNRGLSIIALSQLNRRSYEDVKNKIRKNHRSTGKYDDLYDLSCFAESSELANAADVAIALYTDDNLKKVHKAMVQLLKNRNGETIETPFEVSALPQYSYFGDFSVPGDDGGYLQELVNELLGI